MSLIARIALAMLLATAQLPPAFALDNAATSVVQDLVPFSSDEGLVRLARSTAKVDFPALANSSRPNPTPRSVVQHPPPSFSTPFAVEARTCLAIEAACARKTFNTFRATSIQQFHASHKTT